MRKLMANSVPHFDPVLCLGLMQSKDLFSSELHHYQFSQYDYYKLDCMIRSHFENNIMQLYRTHAL